MPFPFCLPTTSVISISASLSSSTHPALPQAATIHRNTLRSVLKRDKRLNAQSRSSNISNVQAAVREYLQYLFVIDAGLCGKSVSGEDVTITLRKEIEVQWRSTLTNGLTARESRRAKGRGLDFELVFALSSLAYSYTLQARSSLLVLYGSVTPEVEQRAKIVQNATKSLLIAASIHAYISARTLEVDAFQGVVETLSQTQSALASLARAEATLLAVLKDDPHPFVVAQQRNKHDKDWMIKAPEIPKVRAHLFARLCLAAVEHASTAEAGLSATGRVDKDLMHYVKDLRRTARAKACRLFGIDAELGSETGKAIAWLQAARQELGFSSDKGSSGSSIGLGKLKQDWMERREDKKIERSSEWGSDAGRLEELRVVDYLETKWTKMNDTINTQLIPPHEPLVATMPSGRDIHFIPTFEELTLGEEALASLRAPPERIEGDGNVESDSDEDVGRGSGEAALPGTFPGGSSQSTEPYY